MQSEEKAGIKKSGKRTGRQGEEKSATFTYQFIIDVFPIVSSEMQGKRIAYEKALNEIRKSASKKGISIGPVWESFPARDGKAAQVLHYVDVEEDATNRRLALTNAARRLYSFFGRESASGFLHGDYHYPLHISHILHDAEKRERRSAWRGGIDHNFIEQDGPDHCRVHYTVVPYAMTTDESEAKRICLEEMHRIAVEVDAEYHLDIPVRLNKPEKLDEWWAAYDVAVRVPQKDEFSMIEESANRLWKAIDGKKIYIELDDDMSVSLNLLIRHFIPKRRGQLSKLRADITVEGQQH